MMKRPSNVTNLRRITTVPIPASRVLTGALERNLSEAVIIGWDEDGEFYFSSTHSAVGGVLVLMESAKKKLMAFVSDD